MGFLKNSTCLARFIVNDEASRDIDYKSVFAEALMKSAFRAIEEDSGVECSVGWVDLINSEDVPTEEQAFRGEFLAVSMRIDSKKAPASALKASYRKLLLERRQQFPKEKITKDVRQELKTIAKEALLKKAIPSSKVYDVIWDLRDGALWLSATSDTVVERFINLFKNTFGLKLTKLFPYNLGLYLSLENPAIAEKLKREDKDNVTLLQEKEFFGRDFLTWLWYKSEIQTGKYQIDSDHVIEYWPGNRIVLASETNEEQISCKGENSKWSEAKRALSQGKKVCSSNFKLILPNAESSFTLDSMKLNFKSLKTPKVEVNKTEDPEGLFFEKVFLYQEIIKTMDKLYVQFLETYLTQWSCEWKAIQDWFEKSEL